MRARVVAGRFFDSPDERAVVLNEFLLYQFGVTDDAPEEVIGKKIRLEFRIQAEGFGLNFYLSKPNGSGMTAEEASGLEKVRKQLSHSLEKFDLTSAERGALQQVLREQASRESFIISEEFPIVGVYRLPVEEEAQNRWWDDVDASILLPAGTAAELYFRAPPQGQRGLDQATIFADREENVKEVLQSVRDMGFNAHGMLEFIEREQLMFLLIFGAMTSIAGVALLVAALGIANTMLMSVLERTREVGIMKAVGARNGQIQLIFLLEGGLIGLFGGGLGLLLGRVAAIPADAWVRSMVSKDLKVDLKESLFVFPPWLMIAVVSFAVIVTTLAAVYPARRAAKVNPVTALRHE
jgi:putative ABC transport system permease protein